MDTRKIVIGGAALLLAALATVGVVLLTGNGGTDSGGDARSNTLQLAADYLERGEYDRALQLIERLLIEDPNDDNARDLFDEVLAAKQRSEQQAVSAEAERTREQQEQITSRLEDISDSVRETQPVVNPVVTIQPQQEPDQAADTERETAEQRRAREVRALIEQGAAALNRNELPEAREKFEAALALDEDNARALAFLGETLSRQGEPGSDERNQAVEYANRAIAEDQSLSLPHATLAKIYEDTRNYSNALDEYEKASRLNPGDWSLLYSLGRVQYISRQYAEALQSFNAAIHLKPDFERAHFNKGKSLERLDEPRQAVAAYLDAVNVRPDYAAAYYSAAVLQKRLGNQTAALANFEKAAGLDGRSAVFRRALATAYIERQRFQEAEQQLTAALRITPEDANANFNMAVVKLALDKPAEALPFAQRALTANADSPSYNYQAALVHEKLGNTDQAIALYGEAVTKNPKHVDSLVNLGRIFDDRGLYDQALPLLRAAYENAPGSYIANNNLGNVYLHKELYDQAIDHLKRALTQRPEATDTRYNLGLAYLEVGRDGEAQQAFEEVVKIDPNFWDAYYEFAKLLLKGRNEAQAKQLLTALKSRNPAYPRMQEVDDLLARLN